MASLFDFLRRRSERPWRFTSPRVIVFLLRWRRTVIVLMLCLALVLLVERLAPPPRVTAQTITAAADLPLGQVLTATDLEVTDIPASSESSPSRAAPQKEDFIGSVLAVPLIKGQEVSQNLMVGENLLSGMAGNVSAVPLRLADPGSARLLSAGQQVDVFMTATGISWNAAPGREAEADTSAPPGSVEVRDDSKRPTGRSPLEPLASAVPVLWVQPSGTATSPWSSADAEGLIVVAAQTEQAGRLATTPGRVSVVIVNPLSE